MAFHPVRRLTRFALVAGIGAAVGYLFDKDQGQARRRQLQERVKSFAESGARSSSGTPDGPTRPDPDLFPSPSPATAAAGYVAPQPEPGQSPEGRDDTGPASTVAANQGDALSVTSPERRP
jgi:hypothetical protein